MRIIKLFSIAVFSGSCLLFSAMAFAHEGQVVPMQDGMTSSETPEHQAHDHRKDHGAQIHQLTTVESKWTLDDSGQGTLKSELETRVGSDENRLFIKINTDQPESQQTAYKAKALYSRMISDFWDVQAGVQYSHDQGRTVDRHQTSAVLGLYGLAPYFFETEAYVYIGEDRQLSFSLETKRDVLLTQQLILKPHLDFNVIFSDDSPHAVRTGLNSAQAGLEIRYEINKKVMPFIDVAYAYHRGNQQTEWQHASSSEQGGLYAAGIRFKF
ncbi:copper resistance protein B [Acinetobacter sp. WZC-1]|uniref:copper resistance protein B n=1 Tax=Acinetobacter sp. WZC-1 TaxID=3459034 RepID=UPI00403D7CA9